MSTLVPPEEDEAAPPPHALFLSAARLQEKIRSVTSTATSTTIPASHPTISSSTSSSSLSEPSAENPFGLMHTIPNTSASSVVISTAGPPPLQFQQRDLPAVSFPVMEDIRRMGKLCDVTIKVGDNAFHAHRIVLAATIPYFHAMFTHDMAESRKKEITIKMVEPSAMEALINFAYSGKVTITSSNVHPLMMGADFLQLGKVRDACAEFLVSGLAPDNVLGVASFAESLNCTALVTACEKYAQKFFASVAESCSFEALGMKQLFALVNHDELHVSSEEVVFNAILRWVKHETAERVKELPRLLTCVRLPLLSPQFLSDKVASVDLIRSSLKCRDLLDEARDYHLMPERRPLLQSFRTKPRLCKDLVGVIYAVGGQTKSGNSLSTVEVYDPIVGRWRDAEAMSMHRSRVGVAVMRNRLYAIGGYNGSDRLNTVEVFDAQAKRWPKIASMNCKRSAVGAVAVNDEELYVCGGFNGISSLNTVERFSPTTGIWTLVADMTKHRSAAGVVCLHGKIYVLGGHNGLSIFESVECYDAVTDSWKEAVPMLNKRCRLGVATLGGKIYACGGYDGSAFLKSVEVFDPVANKWSFVSPMNVTRSRVALVANMDRLWAIGGYDGMKNLSNVEMYCPEKDEWSFVSSMEAHEGGVGVGVIPLEEDGEGAGAWAEQSQD